MNKNNINLIKEEDCTGCRVCYNSCPFDAISILPNKEGFLNPVINKGKCKDCGICYNACPVNKKTENTEPIAIYAGQCNNKDLLMKSSSGGIFAAIASYVLEHNGIVFGCHQDNEFNVNHISIECKDELYKLQGSKYVQSDIGITYNEAKEYLIEGKLVLYSGTPCQIDGLKNFLGKEYSNLITIDLICHGVGSNQYYKDYLNLYERKKNIEIIDYRFRTKTSDFMTCQGELIYKKRKKLIIKPIYNDVDIYYEQYMKGVIYRKACYNCRYANKNRISDLTIGDYWGIEIEHPEITLVNGISVILVNTQKGINILKKSDLSIYNSTFDKASKFNLNLKHPTQMTKLRNEIFDSYVKGGFEEVVKKYSRRIYLKKGIRYIKNIVPIAFKRKLKSKLRGGL